MSLFSGVSTAALTALAGELSAGRLQGAVSAAIAARHVPLAEAEATAHGLEALAGEGLRPAQMAMVLRLLVHERQETQRARDRVELVWSGPEQPGSATRDTAIVVRELFARAEQSVLVTTFAIHQGQQVFEGLARRMTECPGLRVRFVVNIARDPADTRPAELLLRAFAEAFRTDHWPTGARLPDVYYDPRALSSEWHQRAVLHAKCLVVDDRWAFVTSANFTEAAQDRNIEAGLLLDEPSLARALRRQFDSLIEAGLLKHLLL